MRRPIKAIAPPDAAATRTNARALQLGDLPELNGVHLDERFDQVVQLLIDVLPGGAHEPPTVFRR